ncbi:MAG: DNA-3-methyladenine glycosylase 2 family protein [Deltaproteobacteria bacterium]|nr:MAG: DNA-3-methyladenine glycosylase 2 family protein [Deltaproteobacteria bacterium]
MNLITFKLEPVPPFRLDLTVWALRRRADNVIDRWDGRIYRRVFVIKNKPVEIAVEQLGSLDAPKLTVTARGERLRPEMKSALVQMLQRVLGLQIDLSAFYRLAEKDRKLKGLAQKFRGLKPPRFVALFEALTNGIACQQLTLTVGILLLNRLTTNFGLSFQAEPFGHAFLRPEDLTGSEAEDLGKLGFSHQKALALTELSRILVDRRLSLEYLEDLEDETAMAQLRELRGVGRWTAEYVLLRGLGRLHVFPGDDVGVRKKLQRWLDLEEPLDYAGVNRLLASWRPYGGFIYFHLLLDSLREEGYLK